MIYFCNSCKPQVGSFSTGHDISTPKENIAIQLNVMKESNTNTKARNAFADDLFSFLAIIAD